MAEHKESSLLILGSDSPRRKITSFITQHFSEKIKLMYESFYLAGILLSFSLGYVKSKTCLVYS